MLGRRPRECGRPRAAYPGPQRSRADARAGLRRNQLNRRNNFRAGGPNIRRPRPRHRDRSLSNSQVTLDIGGCLANVSDRVGPQVGGFSREGIRGSTALISRGLLRLRQPVKLIPHNMMTLCLLGWAIR
jgi:hypothetical protein